MTIDTNGFGQALLEYKTKNHEGMTKEQIKADLQKIFDKFGVNSSNFFTIDMATDPKTEASLKPYIDKIAEEIIDRESRNKERGKIISQAKQNSEKQTEKKQNKAGSGKKKAIAFNITDWGPIEPEQLGNHISGLLLDANFTRDELTKPLSAIGSLNYGGKTMDLNINPQANIVDQHVEMIKKLYFVLVKGLPVKLVRRMTMLELSKPITAEQTVIAHKTDDGLCLHKSTDTTTKDIYVSANLNENSSASVSQQDALTPQDFALLKKYKEHGIIVPGVGTHTELMELIYKGKIPKPEQLGTENSHNHLLDDTVSQQK